MGKSCLIKRYCEEKFITKYISTIGIDFGVKAVEIDGEEVRVNFWDLSGHPEFFEVRNEFYKDTQVSGKSCGSTEPENGKIWPLNRDEWLVIRWRKNSIK